MVAISDTLWESLPCLRSSEGFMVSITNTESMAIMATTTRSSMRVKESLDANPSFSLLSLGIVGAVILLLPSLLSLLLHGVVGWGYPNATKFDFD